MRESGVRELKASRSQDDFAQNLLVRVTVHGRPVADIVPAGVAGHDRVRELVAEGRVVAPSLSHPARAPRLAKAHQNASSLVLSERDAER